MTLAMAGRGVACPILALLFPIGLRGAENPDRDLVRGILKELIEINTTDSVGDNTRAAEAMASRLRAAGFAADDVRVLAPAAHKGNLVARLRGSGQGKPILFIAHLDVVEARKEDWSFDPFQFRELDGYFYGRGTSDDKSGDAMIVANFIRLKKEGFVPSRDLILALTSDEEGGNHNGVEWLVKNHRDLIDADYSINLDSGEGELRTGKRILMSVQAAEKTYASFRFTVKDSGGHSSIPTKHNAIYRLAHALIRVEAFEFPVHLNPITHAFFEKLATTETGPAAQALRAVTLDPPDPKVVAAVSATPYLNAILHTTCVATMLSGGHAENALPQTAEAVLNCRLVPGESPSDVIATLRRVIADDQVSVAPMGPDLASPVSVIRPEILKAIEGVTDSMWPGIPVVPIMETGATDGRILRLAGIPNYGCTGIFYDSSDIRAHGKDERVGVESFFEGVEFNYRLLKRLGAMK